jgi:hypothetical protein
MTDDLRAQAISSIKAKGHFWRILIGAVVLSALLIIIWVSTSGPDSYFWPMWPMLGLAIGVVAAGVAAFGPGNRGPSEDRIRAEMNRLSQ